jgi:hypothetical protein
MLTAVDFGSSEAARHHRRVWVNMRHLLTYPRGVQNLSDYGSYTALGS